MASTKKPNPSKTKTLEDPQLHKNFSYNLDACIVQGSRNDRDTTPTGPGVVERVWITNRPPRLGHGVMPTVSARRAYVMLTHIQGQTIDTGDMVCKKVCTSGGASGQDNPINTAANPSTTKQASACASRGPTCD
ncbi:Hypothetical protein CINCED_3A020490 [Cinara cedri]|uniref:Uncharacterized protein n=1 Tax=Cinara cedri TaxID=506608 RepID=A0A5E4M788_9HEMI|nr:Hypothetical protein CINCED_3A020490 [Cinara cedri]